MGDVLVPEDLLRTFLYDAIGQETEIPCWKFIDIPGLNGFK